MRRRPLARREAGADAAVADAAERLGHTLGVEARMGLRDAA